MSTICHYKSSQRHKQEFDLQAAAEMQQHVCNKKNKPLVSFSNLYSS